MPVTLSAIRSMSGPGPARPGPSSFAEKGDHAPCRVSMGSYVPPRLGTAGHRSRDPRPAALDFLADNAPAPEPLVPAGGAAHSATGQVRQSTRRHSPEGGLWCEGLGPRSLHLRMRSPNRAPGCHHLNSRYRRSIYRRASLAPCHH